MFSALVSDFIIQFAIILRLSEKEEKCDALQEQLHYKEEELHSIETQRSRHDREGSSRVANLNQALTHVKQTCSQLTEENSLLKDKESELLDKIKTLKSENDALVKKLYTMQEADCHRGDISHMLGTPTKVGGAKPGTTTTKPIPEETRLDTLVHENSKLKQELQCLQTNFQMTCTKSSQMKKEKKELEKAMSELQVQYDRTLDEKVDIQQKFEEAKATFANQKGAKHTASMKNELLTKEVASLQDQLENLQRQNLELQTKLRKELQHSLESQDTIESLEAQIRTLTAEKAHANSEFEKSQAMFQEVQEELASLQATKSQHLTLEQQAAEAMVGYKRKVAALKTEKLELKDQLERAGKSLNDATTKVQEFQDKEASLIAKVASLEAKNAALRAQAKERAHLPNEMQSLHTKLAELSDQLEEANAQKSTLEEGKEKVNAQVQELTKANKKLTREAKCNWELANKLQKELEKMETATLEAKESYKEKEREQTKLMSEMDDLKLKLSSTESQKNMYEAEVDRLLKKLEELELNNFELSTKLNDIENESNSTKLTKSEKEVRVLELEQRLQLLEGALLERDSIISDLKCAGELMECENATLVSQVTSLSEMVTTRNSKVDALHSQLSIYESETRDIVEKVTELETSHGQCTTIRHDLEGEIDVLKESLEAAKAKEREAENTILTLKLQVMELKESNSGLDAIITHIQEDTQSKIAKSEEMATQNTELQSHIHTMKQDLDSKSATLKATKEEMEYLKKCLVDTESSLRAEMESLDERCNNLREQVDAGEEKKTELASRVVELESKLREEKHKASALREERDAASEQLSSVQTDLNTFKDQLIMVKAELRSTKTALNYQEQKLSEAERERKAVQDELDTITEQYETLRESALTVLERAGPRESKDENGVSQTTSKKLKGILKNPGKQKVLQSVENLC